MLFHITPLSYHGKRKVLMTLTYTWISQDSRPSHALTSCKIKEVKYTIILRDAFTTMTLKKIAEDNLAIIQVKCVQRSQARQHTTSAYPLVRPVSRHIIEWKSSTTQKSTKVNSVKPIQTTWKIVSMASCVLLLILKEKSPLIYCI
jgi:hypothetical protein